MLVFFLYSRSNLRNFDLGQLLEEIYLVTEGAADSQEGKWKTIQSLEKKTCFIIWCTCPFICLTLISEIYTYLYLEQMKQIIGK